MPLESRKTKRSHAGAQNGETAKYKVYEGRREYWLCKSLNGVWVWLGGNTGRKLMKTNDARKSHNNLIFYKLKIQFKMFLNVLY